MHKNMFCYPFYFIKSFNSSSWLFYIKLKSLFMESFISFSSKHSRSYGKPCLVLFYSCVYTTLNTKQVETKILSRFSKTTFTWLSKRLVVGQSGHWTKKLFNLHLIFMHLEFNKIVSLNFFGMILKLSL